MTSNQGWPSRLRAACKQTHKANLRCKDLAERLADAQAEIARHHADFERWEEMAARGARRIEENRRMRLILQNIAAATEHPPGAPEAVLLRDVGTMARDCLARESRCMCPSDPPYNFMRTWYCSLPSGHDGEHIAYTKHDLYGDVAWEGPWKAG